MPHPDQQRWDKRYAQEVHDDFLCPRHFLTQVADQLPYFGLALDVAMGLGGNAAFLLRRGLRVIGVDISMVALRAALQRLPGLDAVQADLMYFWLPDSTFDVILNFYYLERNLWPVYSRALKPSGILVFETLTQEMRLSHPEIDVRYLLELGELRQGFPELETLVYQEGWIDVNDHTRPVASLVARKPLKPTPAHR